MTKIITTNEKVKKAFSLIEDYCVAIYYGGSRVDPVIDCPHDYDYICFAKHLQRQNILRALRKHNFRITRSKIKSKDKHNSDTKDLIDLSQIRVYPYTEISWFSYLDILMEHLIGEEVCPKTDIINEHRTEFIECLQQKMDELLSGRLRNQKRWYHLLRGAYILINNSYEVTPEQRYEINVLHDLSDGWELVRDKTICLIQTLK